MKKNATRNNHTNKEESFQLWESMQVINNMIHAARYKLGEDGFNLIFWGWLLAIAALIRYVTIQLMVLYEVATFLSGGLLQLKPLMYGAFASFACAVLSGFLSEVNQLLCIAVALFFSYILPGHLLRSKFRSQYV